MHNMKQLLKIEWLKVKNYRTFWILTSLYLISIWGINFIVFRIQHNIYQDQKTGDAAKMFIGGPPYAFPKVWEMTTYVSSFLLFIAGLIMIISVTNEYSFKTHRQNVIDGVTRTQFIVTKLVCGFIIALASTVFVALTAMYFGFIEEGSSFSLDNTINLVYFFLQALSYCWLAILFSLLFKRSGISIGVFFLYILVLENVLVQFINYLAKDFTNGPGKFLPIQSSDELMPLPILQNVKNELVESSTNITVQIIVVLCYLTLYFFISKRKFETDDL